MTTTDTTRSDDFDDTDEPRTISPAELASYVRELQADVPSMAAATALLNRMRADLAATDPTTIALFAAQRFEGRVVDAIAALSGDMGEIFEELAFISKRLDEAIAEDRIRTEPLVHEAARRVLRGGDRLAEIASQLKFVKTPDPYDTLQRFQRAGLSSAEIATLEAQGEAARAEQIAALEAERASLEAVLEIMRAYLKTRDESILPEGFAPTPPAGKVMPPVHPLVAAGA
ncbi:MAG: hypothetical protein KAX47_01580 [Zoogloea sp.]|nr:hypothetical protein [Zoogloea sp.]